MRNINQTKIIRITVNFFVLFIALAITSPSFAVELINKENKFNTKYKTNTNVIHIHTLEILKDCESQIDNHYPVPIFHFQVNWGNGAGQASFSEVSGIDENTENTDYRDNNIDGKIITLKNGISNSKFDIAEGMDIKLFIIKKQKQSNKQDAIKNIKDPVILESLSFSPDIIKIEHCSQNNE